MKKRYVVVEGVTGQLVADPVEPAEMRYVGMKRMIFGDGKQPENLVDFFKPAKRLVPASLYIMRAIHKGSLKQHGDIIWADTLEEAGAKMEMIIRPPENKTGKPGRRKVIDGSNRD